jgi:NhaP-type Na+/H+ or K+/H+ antiporter
MEGHANLVIAIALAVGVVAQAFARHTRLPAILVLLVAGVGVGPDGLGWVRPAALEDALFAIADFAVAVILFEGGLNLDLRRLRREQTAIRRLVTWGAALTAIGATLVVRATLGWGWTPSALFGALVIVTGPTVIGPILRELRLQPRVATVLEAEGVLIDPIGALVAVIAVQIALAPEPDAFASGAAGLVARLLLGTAAGVGLGVVLGVLLRARRVVPEGLANVLTLALVFVGFEAADSVLSESGILVVTLAGIVVGNMRTRVDRDLREFKDQLTVLLIGLLFVLLAADVRLADLRALGVEGAVVVGLLIVVVRPLGVFASTIGSDLRLRERAFLAGMAPRGIVAAAIATLAARSLEAAGASGGVELRALVFLTIAGTVTIAGAFGWPLARLCGVQAPPRAGVAILGAEGLGLALAGLLRDAGVPASFLDSNPGHCRAAEEAGFPVTFGNALEDRNLALAQLDRVRSAVGLTANEGLNALFVEQAREEFGVPEVYVALTSRVIGLTEDHMERREARVLFDGPKDVERWNVRFRHGQARIEPFVYEARSADAQASAAAPGGDSAFVMLAVRRKRDLRICTAEDEPKPGDVAYVAIYSADSEAALAALAARGWMPAEAPAEQA